MATSWGTRKALGRRYGQDPALLMELERLEREYALAPGREARRLQAEQFAESINQQNLSRAQNQAQFDAAQSGQKVAGITGTLANLGATGAIVRGMTKAPGEPFFGIGKGSAEYEAAKAARASSVGTAPVAGYTQTVGNMSGPTGIPFGSPEEAFGMSIAPQAVNPAIIDATTSGIAAGADVGMGAGTAAAAPSTFSTYAVPGAQALALYQGSRWAGNQFKEDTFANRALRDPITGLAGEGLRGAGKLTGIKELNKVADTMNQVEKDFIQKPIDAVTKFVSNVVSDIFGW